ncbi:MAG: acylphosphatase [Bacteroidota bacterium]
MTCYGRVQGVFYRASTKEMADKLGLCGWVKNQENGTVLIHAEGSSKQVDELLAWCCKGPLLASVSNVETVLVPKENFGNFEVRY